MIDIHLPAKIVAALDRDRLIFLQAAEALAKLPPVPKHDPALYPPPPWGHRDNRPVMLA